jgi:hypothetical protein
VRTDDLTGLFNQRHFHDRLRDEAARAQRQKIPLSLIVFDLDGFKQVNDRLGHLEGDRILRSFAEVGLDLMTSPNGLWAHGRRKPPVFHRRRLSCTRPSNGRRNTTQGSHIDRGITLTPSNSSWAFFGRSPPRMVIVKRTMLPRTSSPASAIADVTMCDKRGLLATTMFAPGRATRASSKPSFLKKAWSAFRSASSSTVKRGSGDRLCPSKAGGIRHTPPFPVRSLSCSFVVYSTRPYGGSVTTAWTDDGSCAASQSKQSAWYSAAEPTVTAGAAAASLPPDPAWSPASRYRPRSRRSKTFGTLRFR